MEEHAGLESTVTVRNEFSAVELTLRPYGRGRRLEIRSTLFNTVALLDATVAVDFAPVYAALEALDDLAPDAVLAEDPLFTHGTQAYARRRRD